MTKEEVNPVVHAAGELREGDSDAHVPLTRQVQGHTETWALPEREREVERSRSAG